ncbi:DUF1738 domain-containing protein [Vibrio sp. S11_S32]|uniref:ArdC family protein n=1 Tax=Vibrio sp. S11_S32 TaxID=2720225 RepID=UPI001680EE04|nr:zincin-like metallopeptidase domain-containing protein [Vibrio sp. S11_S32]MBD1576970.1 DUF1738 domain-containing protein [Vibrio sp. S11_S32]
MTNSTQATASFPNSQAATKGLPLETKAQSKSDNSKSKKKKATKEKTDFYQVVTDSIIASLEKGVKPWACPWDTSSCNEMPYNFKSGIQYSGINILLLWGSATDQGFKKSAWLTYKQAQEMGAQVRKGEKGTTIIFYKTYAKEDKQTGEEKTLPVLKTFTVFNIEQMDSIDIKETEIIEPINTLDYSQFAHVEAAIKMTGAKITEAGNKAFFRPSTDEIYLPPRSTFNSEADFFATEFHELTHWTGGETRLDRTKGKRFGDNAYAFEELIAELGSAFLMAEFNVRGKVQHDSYIDNWIKALNNDKRFIFKAASFASKAHRFICESVH